MGWCGHWFVVHFPAGPASPAGTEYLYERLYVMVGIHIVACDHKTIF